ncbi:MAG: peptide chain release factor 2 [Candidatus Pacebacteria bacterium]|nr:peptide chain release factor 2 [Candidatus Paceibacterota bacterium]
MRTVFDLAEKTQKIKELEKETNDSNFWNNQERAKTISRELSELKEEVESFEVFKRAIKDFKEFEEVLDSENLKQEIDKFEKKLKIKEKEIYLSGKYDRGNAMISIYSGAGGQDAQDWAAILLRMYNRYCERKGFKVSTLDESWGEGGGSEGRIGIKSVAMLIEGKFVYGFLKRETGVHRLVRISPFSAQKLRHTSFALVEVLPEIGINDIDVKTDDLRIDTYKASGPGGQYVNKRESAIRITHVPTGIVVNCQSERLQGRNKERAMSLLMSKLYQYQQEKQEKEVSDIKGEKISASWGNQIRSYVLHPYKMVKDNRTEIESSQPDKVLDGDLDEFIEAEIKL